MVSEQDYPGLNKEEIASIDAEYQDSKLYLEEFAWRFRPVPTEEERGRFTEFSLLMARAELVKKYGYVGLTEEDIAIIDSDYRDMKYCHAEYALRFTNAQVTGCFSRLANSFEGVGEATRVKRKEPPVSATSSEQSKRARQSGTSQTGGMEPEEHLERSGSRQSTLVPRVPALKACTGSSDSVAGEDNRIAGDSQSAAGDHPVLTARGVPRTVRSNHSGGTFDRARCSKKKEVRAKVEDMEEKEEAREGMKEKNE